MSLLGVHLTLLMGPKIPVPAPFSIAEALTSVEVTHDDSGPSGFQLTFQIGRSGPLDLVDYGLLTNPLIRPFTRVVLLVRFAIAPQVLMDGIITQMQLSPSEEPGASTLTVTGEDVSVMMDLEDKPGQLPPALPDYGLVGTIVGKYLEYGLKPPEPPLNDAALNPRNPLKELTVQPPMTDRAFLQTLAQLYGFLFYVTPGPLPLFSQVHWGPPEKLSIPQGRLSVNMGSATNVDSISFRFNPMLRQQVSFVEDDKEQTLSKTSAAQSIVPLASDPAPPKRKIALTDGDKSRAKTKAQGMVDKSSNDVVTATGQLDTLRYNGLLNPRSLIGLRGAGKTYDGLYYVKTVTHSIGKGRYTQSFTLSREGTGTSVPALPP